MDKKEYPIWLKVPADIINEHRIIAPLLLIGGAVLIVLGLAGYVFHGVSFGYHFVKDYFFPKSNYVILSDLRYAPTNVIDLDDDYNIRIEILNFCGNRIFLRTIAPKEYKELFNSNRDFFSTGQGNLSYSVSILTDNREGLLNLLVHSDKPFNIEKTDVSVQGISKSNVQFWTDIKIPIDLSLLYTKHTSLFNMIVEEGTNLTLVCLDSKKCVMRKMGYLQAELPHNLNLIQVNNYKLNNKIVNITIDIPSANQSDASNYLLDLKTRKFNKISTDDYSKCGYRLYVSPLTCRKENYICMA